jgi:hypothetical protein
MKKMANLLISARLVREAALLGHYTVSSLPVPDNFGAGMFSALLMVLYTKTATKSWTLHKHLRLSW